MKERFVDTNVFLRFLTDDIPEQAEQAAELLQAAGAGKTALVTSALVIAEIVWTLESYYELSRGEVARLVLAILNTPGLRVEHGELIAEAAGLYAQLNVDYADAFNACWMRRQGLDQVVTFDRKHFSHFPGVTPRVPQ